MPTLTMHGAQVHYWVFGDGPVTVVGVHGAGGDHTAFDPQVEALVRNGFRVITWDMPPFGASGGSSVPFTARQAREDLLRLLDHLDLERPVLLGQSLGGGVAQSLVKAHPDRAGALAVLGAPWITGPLRAGERLPLKSAAAVMRLMPTRRIHALMTSLVVSTSPSLAVRAEFAELIAQVPRRHLLDAVRTGGQLLDPDPTYRTPIPLCLMRGEHDVTFNVNEIMPRWAAAEGVAEVIIPNAGHVANLDAPQAFNEALLRFLAGLPSSSLASGPADSVPS